MRTWVLRERDLKKYPHFDPVISVEEGQALATDSERVAKHTFYPFIRYHQAWTRFAPKGERGPSKTRPIRYAARADAYILSYYRHILAERYEAELRRLGIDGSVLAYRRIRDAGGEGGKCNIHFARDAVLKIRDLGDCCVVALDISGFFESLDHTLLKSLWCRLLGTKKLPADHFRVFRAVTSYAIVDKQRVYERLGHFGEKRKSALGAAIPGYLTPYKRMPRQLCTGNEFREKIAGGGALKSIIEKHFKPYGIPQGAPISDLLANIYLIDFDRAVHSWVEPTGGAYYRYSDDILIVAPGGEAEGRSLITRTRILIRNFGAQLTIKEEKSSLFAFRRSGDHQTFKLLQGTQGKNGLEYLGFRYDGRKMYLRDSTLSNLRRKVARAARRDADACARRYPNMDATRLSAKFDYERLIKRFGKVEDFEEHQEDYSSWTFWTYAKRAAHVLGPLGQPILRQLRRHRELIRERADNELAKAVARRDRRRRS